MKQAVYKTILYCSLAIFTMCDSDHNNNDPLVRGAADFTTNLTELDGQIHIVMCTPVNFSEMSRDAFSWDWIFEGGTPDTFSGKDPSEIYYYQKGEFDVHLVVNQGDEVTDDTQVKDDYIKVLSFEDIVSLIQTEEHIDGKVNFWTYNADGQPISCKLLENSTAIYGTIFNYDSGNGKVKLVEHYNANGIKVRQEINNFDLVGNQTGYEVINDTGEIEQSLIFYYSGDKITSADMEISDGQGGFFKRKVLYIRDFENNSFIEEYKDPEDDSLLSSVEYTFGDKRNPYYNMGIEPFPLREFPNNIIRKETLDASGNLLSVTIEEVLESDQLGSATMIRRIKDNITILEITGRHITYDF